MVDGYYYRCSLEGHSKEACDFMDMYIADNMSRMLNYRFETQCKFGLTQYYYVALIHRLTNKKSLMDLMPGIDYYIDIMSFHQRNPFATAVLKAGRDPEVSSLLSRIWDVIEAGLEHERSYLFDNYLEREYPTRRMFVVQSLELLDHDDKFVISELNDMYTAICNLMK